MASINYRPEVDGLRALAVIAVVLFHLFPSHFPGGYLGVDIFFVISGYLITSIILADVQVSRFSLREFWARRIRRILPAAVFLASSVLLTAVLLGYPQRELSILGRQLVASLVGGANFAMNFMAGDYWSPAAERLTFLHQWSLAIEEQFYLFYPLLLVWLLAKSRMKAAAILVLIGMASLGAAIVRQASDTAAAFFLPHYRIWELLAGCLLAFPKNTAARPVAEWGGAALVGFALLVSPYVMGSGQITASALAVLGTALYIHGATSGSTTARPLCSAPALYLGKASYSLYLWHWPAIVMAKTMADLLEAPWVSWISVLVMAVGTVISYHWVESRGRRLKAPFVFASVSTSVLLGLSVWATLNTRESPTPGIERPGWMARAYDCVQNPPVPLIGERHLGFELPSPSINPRSSDGHLTGVTVGSRSASTNWFLLGDSHALMWASALDRFALERGVALRVYAGIGLSPLLVDLPGAGLDRRKREDFNKARLQQIAASQPELVILAMRWDSATKPEPRMEIIRLVDAIHSASPGSRLLLLGQPPLAKMSVSSVQWVGWRQRWKMSFETAPINDRTEVREAAAFLRSIANRHPGLDFWDPAPIFARNGRVRMVHGAQILYRDDDHLSEQGAALAFPLLAARLCAR